MVTWMVYLSGGTLTTVKLPVSLVKTSGSFVPRVSLVSVTAAPGMTPPCGSLTVPVTVPVTCADAAVAIAKNAKTAAASVFCLPATIWLLLQVAREAEAVCRNQRDV